MVPNILEKATLWGQWRINGPGLGGGGEAGKAKRAFRAGGGRESLLYALLQLRTRAILYLSKLME